MSLELRKLPDGASLIKLDGDLDIAGVGAIEALFLEHCAGNSPRVLVDLSGVGFIGSLGIRTLLKAIKIVSARSGRLVLLNPTKIADAALDISGFGNYVVRGRGAETSATQLEAGEITTGIGAGTLTVPKPTSH